MLEFGCMADPINIRTQALPKFIQTSGDHFSTRLLPIYIGDFNGWMCMCLHIDRLILQMVYLFSVDRRALRRPSLTVSPRKGVRTDLMKCVLLITIVSSRSSRRRNGSWRRRCQVAEAEADETGCHFQKLSSNFFCYLISYQFCGRDFFLWRK